MKLILLQSQQDKKKKINLLYNNLAVASGKVNALSPLATIARGYSVAFDDNNKIVRSVNDVKQGDRLIVKLNDGNVITTVDNKELTNE